MLDAEPVEEDKAPPLEESVLDGYIGRFPDWVDSQRMSETIFTCDSDIRLDIPFPEEKRIWALWANQNCKDFDLLLTVTLDSESLNNLLGYTGADLTEKGCVYT